MSKGRPTMFGTRLKANGISAELDAWYHSEAERRSTPTKKVKVAMLKRHALEAYRAQYELNTPILVATEQNPVELEIEVSIDDDTVTLGADGEMDAEPETLVGEVGDMEI